MNIVKASPFLILLAAAGFTSSGCSDQGSGSGGGSCTGAGCACVDDSDCSLGLECLEGLNICAEPIDDTDAGSDSGDTSTECEDGDADNDGVCDGDDNCPSLQNADQADSDGDGVGDACDVACDDLDGDAICDEEDNCPNTPNQDQADADENGIGDACEAGCAADGDSDGVCDEDDNCPNTPNPDQADADENGTGTACDPEEGGADDFACVQVTPANTSFGIMGPATQTERLVTVSNCGTVDIDVALEVDAEAADLYWTYTWADTSSMVPNEERTLVLNAEHPEGLDEALYGDYSNTMTVTATGTEDAELSSIREMNISLTLGGFTDDYNPHVAFSAPMGGPYPAANSMTVHVFDAAEEEVYELTFDTANANYGVEVYESDKPEWSPDGTLLSAMVKVYEADTNDIYSRIAVTNMLTGEQTFLFGEYFRADAHSFSPDSSQIVFEASAGPDDTIADTVEEPTYLWVGDVDGSSATQLNDQYFGRRPVWDLSNNTILAMALPVSECPAMVGCVDDFDLTRFAIDGSVIEVINTDYNIGTNDFSLSPDGETIYYRYTSSSSAPTDIYEEDLSNNNASRNRCCAEDGTPSVTVGSGLLVLTREYEATGNDVVMVERDTGDLVRTISQLSEAEFNAAVSLVDASGIALNDNVLTCNEETCP